MRMRRMAAAAAAGLVLLAGCGEAKDAVDKASGAASDARQAADDAKDKARALKELADVDRKLVANPDQALDAARQTCEFIEKNEDRAKQVEEVRQRFDQIGVSSLEAAEAKAILGVLKTEVCPRLK